MIEDPETLLIGGEASESESAPRGNDNLPGAAVFADFTSGQRPVCPTSSAGCAAPMIPLSYPDVTWA